VLAGGAARGAYEVGILSYVFDEVSRALGAPVPLDILCGTSVGAINACALAAAADDPPRGVATLLDAWRTLDIAELVKPNAGEIAALVRNFVSPRAPPKSAHDAEARRGGVLDPAGVERLVRERIAFSRIRDHVKNGKLSALTVSTTDVATGRTVIFVEHGHRSLPVWSRDPTIVVRETHMEASHALASAAVPFLFPPVRIKDEFHCDGGLRQNVPLSPARRLGAEGLLVVNPRYVGPPTPSLTRRAPDHVAAFPGTLALAGKALNALLLDRIDNDIGRLHRINDILEAGVRRYGPTFVDEINAEIADAKRVAEPHPGEPPPRNVEFRPLNVVHVRASIDIGAAAGAYVRSPDFAARAPAVTCRLLRRLADWAGEDEADLLSYVLFDGEFAARLIEVGRADAAERHEELCGLFAARVGRQAPRV
jgi:NTE family protein